MAILSFSLIKNLTGSLQLKGLIAVGGKESQIELKKEVELSPKTMRITRFVFISSSSLDTSCSPLHEVLSVNHRFAYESELPSIVALRN
ncbi:hypothetical protein Leryth_010819 [Lithospermum erythrorhizon]|nr:hypothetical protein Leryth_010819 [Lithospermum erythrorhizon]